jgi:hypothetical protein
MGPFRLCNPTLGGRICRRPVCIPFCFPRSVPFHQHLSVPLGLSTTYREFLLLRPEPRATGSSTRRPSATSASDSDAETSESKTPDRKRRKTSHPRNTRRTPRPEVVEMTNLLCTPRFTVRSFHVTAHSLVATIHLVLHLRDSVAPELCDPARTIQLSYCACGKRK